MRQNDPSSIPGPSLIPDHRPPARARAWAWNGVLAVLMVVTSLAVASVSAWLVLPYLALMAVILITPPGQRQREEDRAGESGARSGPGAEGVEDRAGAGDDPGDAGRALTDPAAGSELGAGTAEPTDSDPAPRPAKAGRGKGRGRKAKAKANAEPPGATVPATWIRIGPGKFVRAEAPGPAIAPPFSSSESEGVPAGPLTPSSGTVEGPADSFLSPDRDDVAEAAMAAEVSSPPVRGPEARAASASDGPSAVEPDPIPVEGDLEPGPDPDDAAATAEAIDAALESPQGAPPYVSDPSDFFASLSGLGERPTGAFPPGCRIEAEAVPTTAEGSTAPAPGEGSEVWDGPAPGEPVVDESVSTPLGGDPGHAWDVAFAVENGFAVETDRDAGDQVPDRIGEACVDGAALAAAQGIEATSELGLGSESESESEAGSEVGPGGEGDEAGDNGIAPEAFAEVTRDNGIAPDALVDVPPAVIETETEYETETETENEDASPRDRGEDAAGPAASSGRSDRPEAGRSLAPWRGYRPRGVPATRWRSGREGVSPGRVVRSGRRDRVTPVLRRPLRRTRARSRPACRTFPPRSPPASAARS